MNTAAYVWEVVIGTVQWRGREHLFFVVSRFCISLLKFVDWSDLHLEYMYENLKIFCNGQCI